MAGCNDGICVIRSCAPGFLDCPGDGSGCGTPETEENCGGCGVVCGDGETCCEGACVELQGDRDHCGTCGNRCGVRFSCCDGLCSDTLSSLEHCGACGIVCPEGQRCRGGRCSG